MPTSRQRLIRGAALAAFAICLVAGAVVAWRTWRERAWDARFDAAVRSLRDGVVPDDLDETVRALDAQAGRGPESLLLQGAAALRLDDPLRAAELLTQVRPQGRYRLPALLWQGEALYKIGRLADAELALRTVTVEHPDAWEARRWLASVYRAFGSLHAALKELEEYARLRPDDFLPHRLIGLLHKDDFHTHEEAAASFRRALERDPPEPERSEIRLELARSLMLAEEFGQALEVLHDAPEGPVELALRAECQWGLGDADRTAELLDRLARVDPRHHAVFMLGALVAIDRGEPQAALPLLETLLERDPHDFVARHQLSLAYKALGDEAASATESARMLASQDLSKLRDELHTRAIRNPADAAVRERLAEVYDRLGQPAQAEHWRRSAEQTRAAVSGARAAGR